MTDLEQFYMTGNHDGVFTLCPVNRLLSAFADMEHQLYVKHSIPQPEWESFVTGSISFITTIPVDYFQNKIRTLGRNSCNLLTRTLDRFSNLPEANKLEPYYKALCEV